MATPKHPFTRAAQHSVRPTGGSLRVFRHFAWLEAGSVKMVLSRPTHPRVTHTVSPQNRVIAFEIFIFMLALFPSVDKGLK